ncbi:MAG: LPS export ABC transporter periplasmic protein LptC [Bacteroidaceae bacterium]|nr:LPS export ABC transporter periplasmic protein LptC [Bacteroidaceae bacterium]MBP9636908.1 LPS export ABC transporter periplasmic protein LptC [Bacteroidaceae bacterium]
MDGETNHSLRILPLLLFIACTIAFAGCEKEKKQIAPAIKQRDSIPVLATTDMVSLISDSGLTKYRITAKDWKIFDRTRVPKWTFEKGLLLEQFDKTYKVISTIQSDTAYYYSEAKVWELRGRVKIRNEKGDKFFTQQLFWDEGNKKLFSKKPIRIEQNDKIITGKGFESNQEMTVYQIYSTAGQVMFDEGQLNRPKKKPNTENPNVDPEGEPSKAGNAANEVIPRPKATGKPLPTPVGKPPIIGPARKLPLSH